MLIKHLKSKVVSVKNSILRMSGKAVITLTPALSNNKNILLSYITHPFNLKQSDPRYHQHSNIWECQEIVKIWLNNGYTVDVIDWDNKMFIPKKNYEIFIDIHSNMERLAPYVGNSCIKVLHITGAHWRFQNDAEIKRLSDLKIRKDVELKPRRQVPASSGIEHADCATILGNSFTQGTFAFAKKPLYPIKVSSTLEMPYIIKDYNRLRKNFLWFGGPGMVHKGLDLVLEAFNDLPNYNLTVCGPVCNEEDFINTYYQELYRSPNNKTVGYVDVHSSDFIEVVNNSIALIYPSCSEGQAGSVINCMHAGLIPILSYETGIDVDGFGILLHDCKIDTIKDAIIKISQLDEKELKKMAYNSWDQAQSFYTRENFSKTYKIISNKVIEFEYQV